MNYSLLSSLAVVPVTAAPCVDEWANCTSYLLESCWDPLYTSFFKQHCPMRCGLCGESPSLKIEMKLFNICHRKNPQCVQKIFCTEEEVE